MFVKPQPGRSVPDPERGGLLAEAGREVSDTSTYWHRRVEDKDVEVVDPSEVPAASPAVAELLAPTEQAAAPAAPSKSGKSAG